MASTVRSPLRFSFILNPPDQSSFVNSIFLPFTMNSYWNGDTMLIRAGEGVAMLDQHDGTWGHSSTMVRRGDGRIVDSKYFYPTKRGAR